MINFFQKEKWNTKEFKKKDIQMYFTMLLLETSGDGLEKDRNWGRGMTLIKRNGKSQVLSGNEVGKKES